MGQTERELKWHRRFLDVARLVSTWSKDPSTQTGGNGFARGVDDSEERYADREVKYRFVVHCNTNAIYSAALRGVSLRGATMYLTGPPCNECMKGIVQSGITRVVWPEDNPFEKDVATQQRWQGSIEVSNAMARAAGIEFLRVPDPLPGEPTDIPF